MPDISSRPDDVDRTLRSRSFLLILMLSAVVGVGVSVIAWGYLAAIHGAQHWIFDVLPAELGIGHTPVWWSIPVLVVAGCAVGCAVRYLPGRGGHPAFEGLATHPPMASDLLGVAAAGFASLIAGAVIGPEMPLLVIGSGLAMVAVRQMRADAPDELLAVMAAAGSFAAVSFIFGSPVIAAVILMEVIGLSGPRAPLVLLPGLVAAGLGSLTYLGVKSWAGLDTSAFSLQPVHLPVFATPGFLDFVWAIALGVAAAIVAMVVMDISRWLYPVVMRRTLILTPLAGLVIGAIAVTFHSWTGHTPDMVLFSGESALGTLVGQASGWTVGAVAALMLCKGVAWAISMSSFRGGAIFPAIFIGTAGGLVAAHLPGLSLSPAVAVAIAAMVVSMTRLPLSSIVLASLLTASAGFGGVMPLVIVGTVVAFLMTKWLEAWRERRAPDTQSGATTPAPA